MPSLTSDQAAFMLHALGLPALKAEHAMTSAVIAAIPSERAELLRMVDFYGLRTFPAIGLLQLILNHTIHHRGQLSTYLRPMGAKVPSLYGPSYDAGGFTGRTVSRRSG